MVTRKQLNYFYGGSSTKTGNPGLLCPLYGRVAGLNDLLDDG